jgi:Ni/Co efflux regulator RcnB
MKKLIVLLMLAAFACSPLIMSDAQAAPHARTASAKHLKKSNHKLKQKVHNLRHKLHKTHQHKHHKAA